MRPPTNKKSKPLQMSADETCTYLCQCYRINPFRLAAQQLLHLHVVSRAYHCWGNHSHCSIAFRRSVLPSREIARRERGKSWAHPCRRHRDRYQENRSFEASTARHCSLRLPNTYQNCLPLYPTRETENYQFSCSPPWFVCRCPPFLLMVEAYSQACWRNNREQAWHMRVPGNWSGLPALAGANRAPLLRLVFFLPPPAASSRHFEQIKRNFLLVFLGIQGRSSFWLVGSISSLPPGTEFIQIDQIMMDGS